MGVQDMPTFRAGCGVSVQDKPTFRAGGGVSVQDGQRVVGWQGRFAQGGDEGVAGCRHAKIATQVGVGLLRLQDGLGSTLIRAMRNKQIKPLIPSCALIIIKYCFMCYFSKLEDIAHYKAENQNTVKTNWCTCT